MKLLTGFLAFAGTVVFVGFSVSGYHGEKEMERILPQPQQQQNYEFTDSSSAFSGWGLNDARTSIGHLFRYRIAVERETAVLVVEHGKTQLPDWLHLFRPVDLLNNQEVLFLDGVSGPLERGKRYYIEVIYSDLNHSQTIAKRDEIQVQHSKNQDLHKDDLENTETKSRSVKGLHSEITGSPKLDLSDSLRRDIFAIAVDGDDVRGENTERVGEAAESASTHGACLKERTMTRATVIIDDDFYKMATEDRVSLVHRFCQHLRLSSQLVQLLPTENEGPLIDADWLVAGPGDTTKPTQGHAGVVLQWDVGCNNVLVSQMPALQTLERTVQDGSLRRVVGRGVIGWHVTKKTQLQQRLKRQLRRLPVLPTGTIAKIHPAPTARPVQTTIIINNQESSASVGPALRPSIPKASGAFNSRRLSNISGKKASRNRQSGNSGLFREWEGRKSRTKNPLSSFATPTVASVRPTRVLHVGTKVTEEELTSSADEDFIQSSVHGFILEPSKPYVVSKFPEATTSLPIFRSRQMTATSEAGMAVMTTTYTSIYTQATTLVTEPFEEVIHAYSESLYLTTFLPENLSPASGVTGTTSVIRKYSKIEEEQTPKKSISGFVWDGEEKPPITTAVIETAISGQTTTRSSGQLDGTIGWLNGWDKAKKHTSVANKPQDYEFTSGKPATYREQANLSSESTKAQRKTKTASLPKTSLSTTAKLPSAGTKLFELEVVGSSQSETTSIALTSIIFDTELPTRNTPKTSTPLKLYASSTVTRIGSWQGTPGMVAFGGRRKLTTLPSTVMTNRRLTSPITLSRSTEVIRNNKTSKRLKKKKTARIPKTRKTTPNYAPVVLHELGDLEVLVGSVFRYRIPNNTFLDEDGPTDKLRLMLLTHDTRSWPGDPEDFDRIDTLTTVPPNSWVKLMNSSTQLLYGLPTDEQLGPHEYWLAAIDKQERLTKTRFEIRVRRRPSEEMSLNHEFFIILQLNYEMVIQDVDKRIDIVRKISTAFRDRNTDHVTVTGIRRGSVEFHWTNNSVQASPCPVKILTALRDHIILPNGSSTYAFGKAMQPYKLESVGFVPQGRCLKSFARPQFWDQPVRPVTMTTTSDEEVRKKPKEADDGNFLLYILIPMVGLAAGLLLLLVLCIVCHRCRQRKKTRDTKGIPVIFSEEMAADRPPGHCPRPVLADEVTSPFMLPPTYSQSLPGSRFSTMRSNYKTSDDDSSSGLSSDAEQFSPRSIGQSFPGWPPNCGPPPPYIAPYQPRYV